MTPGPLLPLTPTLPALPRATSLRRPLTPFRSERHAAPRAGASRTVRISTDPCDPRRAVIGGTIGQVCAALEGMVAVEAIGSLPRCD
ncbi:hypothetical protein [Aquariibacter albus]|uniref:Uncharacterized protein n=1 Tax=Aquariibacter albus TaxID=2759899 RepID=A0A839HN90_9BURK|nr:hypothetical protein [Aquariibacter albus]MBB1161068.1 hypothetical protein [Aquariibacter albus]